MKMLNLGSVLYIGHVSSCFLSGTEKTFLVQISNELVNTHETRECGQAGC